MKLLIVIADIMNNSIFRYTDLFKIRSIYFRCNNYLIKQLIEHVYYRKCKEYGAWISLNANFKSKPVFPHKYFGIFISGDSTIGNKCTIYQHVTIGSINDESSGLFGAPNVQDNVLIGAGSKLIGNISIGKNSKIGAGCIVVNDIPENSTAVMHKSRIIIN